MTCAASRSPRIGITLLAAAVMVTVTGGDALAKHRRHIVRHHCACHRVMVTRAAVAPPALGQMRYYGGPKSPMWREVR